MIERVLAPSGSISHNPTHRKRRLLASKDSFKGSFKAPCANILSLALKCLEGLHSGPSL